MAATHRLNTCGCRYDPGEAKPWYICLSHFDEIKAEKFRTTLISQLPAGNYARPNPRTAAIDLTAGIPPARDGPRRHYWLYTLQLLDGKYYVGLTAKTNPYYRIAAHVEHFGARWTMAHSPIDVLEIRDIGVTTQDAAEAMEHRLTLAYMDLYGHKNVRGGKVTYTGAVYRLGSHFIMGYQVKNALVSLATVAGGIYLVLTVQ